MRVTRVLVSPGKSYTSGQLPMNHVKHIRKAIQIILSGITQPLIKHTRIYYSTNNSYDFCLEFAVLHTIQGKCPTHTYIGQ